MRTMADEEAHRRAVLEEMLATTSEPLSFGEEGQASPGTAIVNLSSLDAYLWLEVQDTGDLKLRVAKGFPLSESTAGSGFDWDDSDVHAQADRYIPHLKSLVGPLPNEDIEWVDASNQLPNFLGYDATETLGYEFSGTASVVAIDRSAIEALEPQKGMDLLLDLRKRVTRGDVIQAQAKLLLANLHAPERRPVLVVTDLNDEWLVMWLDASTIYQHAFDSRDQAAGFMRDFLAGRFDTSERLKQSSFAQRHQVDEWLDVSCVRDAAHAEHMNSLVGHGATLTHEALRKEEISHLVRQILSPPNAPSRR